MLAKRIIPCLDVKNGLVVKGRNFENLVELGDSTEMARYYAQQGADEIVFLDISATLEKRPASLEWVKKTAQELDVPFTVGGGITSVGDARSLLQSGSDKISVNTSAVANPALITTIANEFGSQCVVAAIDAKKIDGEYYVFTNSGAVQTSKKTVEWARKVQELGAGEILLTSIDADGTNSGFDLDLISLVSNAVSIPVIASGGAGGVEDFYAAFCAGADAVLAAGVFHRNELSIKEVKRFLLEKKVVVRI